MDACSDFGHFIWICEVCGISCWDFTSNILYKSQNNWMVCVRMNLKAHSVPTPAHKQGCPPPPPQAAQSSSNLALSTSGWGHIQFLFKYLTTFWVKKFLLISNLNQSSFSLKLFLCPITIRLCKKSVSLFISFSLALFYLT